MVLRSTIRRAEQRDFASILDLARLVAEAGDTFPWEGFGIGAPEEEAQEKALLAETWLPDPGQHREAFVCEVEDFAGIAGVYVLQPNGLGRCRHVAQGAYMVNPAMRRRGLGKQLCAHSLCEAQKQHYAGMQFDMVVATNIAAIKAWTSCGFKIMCTLPRVFQHPDEGFVDAHVMFNDFSSLKALGSNHASTSSAPELQPTFGYPTAVTNYSVGDEVNLLPQPVVPAEPAHLTSGLHSHFKVEPPLPEGVFLCPLTGAISGAPVKPCPELTYRITAGATAQVTFGVGVPRSSEASMYIDEAFAAQLEDIVDAAQMPREPARTRAFGDWMIWMVHRAWLNDPALTDFNFNSAHMPAPHLEPRIAPKLMKAMSTNSHIEVLSLSNANVQKSTALELADALRQNCTLRTLNLEANCLDSNCIREVALGIRDNSATQLEHVRLQHQKNMGRVFGRPTEEAVGQMMQRNETLVKLGFECQDAHWRNIIDRALVRNNDFSRRRQQQAISNAVEESGAPPEERTLGQLALQASPGPLTNDFFSENSSHHGLLRAYMAQNLQLPTTSQLQHYAKNSGAPMPYTMAAPLIRQCRSWLLDSALTSEVLIVDAFGMSTMGTLSAWHESGEHWTVDLSAEAGGRLTFKADKEPSVFLSDGWASWLNRTKPASGGGA